MYIWRNAYDRDDQEFHGELTATVNLEASKTKESFAKDADLNVLVKRFGIHGVPVLPIDPSQFGDFSGAPDLREALEIMRDATDQFNALPARIRNRFVNDPAELLSFLRNPENREEAIYLGLIAKTPEKGSQAEIQPSETPPAKPEAPKGA